MREALYRPCRRFFPAAALAAGALLAFALAGCATNPVTGKKELSLVSESQELTIGSEGDKAVTAEYGLYEDARLAAHVDSIGQRLARVSHRPGLTWHFHVVDDPAVNAFALPGGYIYITRGILAYLNSDAQLAGVMGHEIGHVTARHSAQQITRTQLYSLGLGIAAVVSPAFRRYGDAAQTGLGILFLKYSRDDESQADELGVEYATRAGYDPREIPGTYAMLKRVSEQSGQRLPEFLSTHPDPGNRETRTGALAAQAVAGKSGLVVRGPEYVVGLENLLFGADPRQGYFEGDRFYAPELRFTIDFPAGWQHQNTLQAVSAATANGKVGLELSLVEASGASPASYAEGLRAAGKVLAVAGNDETIGGYPAWVGRLVVAGENATQHTLAAVYLRQDAQHLYQILGASGLTGDADEHAIFTAARSFRALSDPARLHPTAQRVHVVRVEKTGLFNALVPGLGAQGLDLEGTSILNNVLADDRLDRGQLVKIVLQGKLR